MSKQEYCRFNALKSSDVLIFSFYSFKIISLVWVSGSFHSQTDCAPLFMVACIFHVVPVMSVCNSGYQPTH